MVENETLAVVTFNGIPIGDLGMERDGKVILPSISRSFVEIQKPFPYIDTVFQNQQQGVQVCAGIRFSGEVPLPQILTAYDDPESFVKNELGKPLDSTSKIFLIPKESKTKLSGLSPVAILDSPSRLWVFRTQQGKFLLISPKDIDETQISKLESVFPFFRASVDNQGFLSEKIEKVETAQTPLAKGKTVAISILPRNDFAVVVSSPQVDFSKLKAGDRLSVSLPDWLYPAQIHSDGPIVVDLQNLPISQYTAQLIKGGKTGEDEWFVRIPGKYVGIGQDIYIPLPEYAAKVGQTEDPEVVKQFNDVLGTIPQLNFPKEGVIFGTSIPNCEMPWYLDLREQVFTVNEHALEAMTVILSFISILLINNREKIANRIFRGFRGVSLPRILDSRAVR